MVNQAIKHTARHSTENRVHGELGPSPIYMLKSDLLEVSQWPPIVIS